VEDPLPTLFLGFNQAEIFQRQHVFLHPLDLFAAHAAALEINGNAGEMGRSNFAFSGRGVAIMTPEFLLDLHRPHSGIQLDLTVKLLVKRLAQVIDKLPGPGTAITAVGIQPRVKAQGLAGNDWNQIFACLELF